HDEAQMPFGGCKASGYGRFGGRAGIAEFTELRCQKMLIVGERSLPYADSDLVQAQGIPVGIVPHAGHSMAWENPQGLAQLIASHS
ncbi:aldehyde dehydrogenase family protein, partial [Klebsiella pneumoniae]|uniref:aldehyde dehydrogenase family protein n=1 Tax=Klebsiella pneumoniae TaxID=573 RepID=UPI001E2882F3|nr:aldehyde dehydrogenase family protein [Klebsiella pneumoniae]